jgi:hypothetical protein
MRVILVTARPGPDFDEDPDMPVLAEAVAATGCEVSVSAWDDPAAGWDEVDLAVVRSPWDYPVRLAAFRAWIDRCAKAGTRLANPAEVLSWNLDKRYLMDLADAGVPVVPTTYLEPGADVELPSDGEFVIKPSVGAGSRLAGRYAAGDRHRAAAHVAAIHAEGLAAMVQPYRPAVDTDGERALVFVGGRFLHAMRKRGVLVPGADQDGPREPHPGLVPWQPSDAELALARQALAAASVNHDILYGRVDLIVEPGRGPTIMELELIEPNLFLGSNPGAATIFADAIAAAARNRP